MNPTLEAIHAHCDEVGDCWEWRGAMDGTAPVMRPAGSRKLAPVRRVVLTLIGKHMEGRLACAKCGNHRCVAPEHAVAWTRTQLQQHTAKATRYGASITRRHKLSMAGRKRSPLAPEQVDAMRASGLTTREAAALFGVCQSTAADIMAGRAWRSYASPFAGTGARA